MKQKIHIPFSLAFLAITTLTACNSVLGDNDIVKKQGENIELAFTRSGESSSATSGSLIFWKERMGDAFTFTAEVNDLTAYETIKFNTGVPYPKDGAEVSATGFSPASMQLSDDYQKLSLPPGTVPGTLDVCTASEVIQGNYYRTFNRTMEFGHTLTRITFFAERDHTMEGSRNVSNIKVTIPTNLLAFRWTWDGTRYSAEQGATPVTPLTPLVFTHPDIIVSTNTDEMGTAYLMLPTGNTGVLKGIRIEADITPIKETEVEKTIDTTMAIQLYTGDNATPVSTALPGEAYEIAIKFQQNSFTLIARQNDWENGGLIYVPVKPGS